MAAIDEAWLDLASLHRAMDARRTLRHISWGQVAEEIGAAASTIGRASEDGRMAGDNAVMFLDWLGLPAEAFVRRGRGTGLDLAARVAAVARARGDAPTGLAEELAAMTRRAVEAADNVNSGGELWRAYEGAGAARGNGRTFTRIDSLALHAAVETKRREQGLTRAQVAAETGLTASTLTNIGTPAAPRDVFRHPYGARIEAHAFVALAHWLGAPCERFLRRPGGVAWRPAELPALADQLSNLMAAQEELPPSVADRLRAELRALCARRGTV